MLVSELQALRDAGIGSEELEKVGRLLKWIYDCGYHRRFAFGVYRRFVEDVDSEVWKKVVAYLLSKGWLRESIELVCPVCDVSQAFSDSPVYVCESCGAEFRVEVAETFVVYSFDDEFESRFR